MTKHRLAALWLMLCTLLSIFNICTILIFDGFDWPFYAVTANAVVSLGGLTYHIHADEKRSKQSRLTKAALNTLLALNSISVFLLLWLSLITLSGEYHNALETDATVASAEQVWQTAESIDKDVVLLQTKDLYIYCTDYDHLSYATGERPSRNDESILMCVAAAFQSTYQLRFHEDNIVGLHTSRGQLEQGAPQDDLGAFTYAHGVASIWDVGEAKAAIREAMNKEGFGYQSFIVLKDGNRGTFDTHEFRCYRVLTVLDGKACIIDSRTLMHFGEFVQALKEFGVSDAIYCDMGSGWNYSWYRDADGRPRTIIGMLWPYSHNWLVFEKNAA